MTDTNDLTDPCRDCSPGDASGLFETEATMEWPVMQRSPWRVEIVSTVAMISEFQGVVD
ncbi:hypothetical protein AADZ90_011940 [Aestuariibius sp. 2305UL40-4]|uniref:hypothetical protein n=1 Tax=Aestuariibius violaceus TaxID=3234132 RepID=UPI00345EDFF5